MHHPSSFCQEHLRITSIPTGFLLSSCFVYTYHTTGHSWIHGEMLPGARLHGISPAGGLRDVPPWRTPSAGGLRQEGTWISQIIHLASEVPKGLTLLKGLTVVDRSLGIAFSNLLLYVKSNRRTLQQQQPNTITGTNNSVRSGSGNIVSGNGNTVISGDNNNVSGSNNTVTSGSSNVIVDSNHVVTGSNNTVSGNNNRVTGNNNVVSGSNQVVSGDNKVVTG